MTDFRNFEDMRVWQEARKLIRSVRAICKKENVRRDWPFIDQITRAARSISANIAEGSDAMTIPEFINFLGYAKRSSSEVRSHFYDALDEKYISDEEFKQLSDQTDYIARMLAKLIHSLQSADPNMKRTFKNTVDSN